MSTELFTKKTLAAFLEVGLWTIGEWTRARYLPAPFRLGTELRWRKSDIDKWIERKAKEAYVPRAMHGIIKQQAQRKAGRGRIQRVRLYEPEFYQRNRQKPQ